MYWKSSIQLTFTKKSIEPDRHKSWRETKLTKLSWRKSKRDELTTSTIKFSCLTTICRQFGDKKGTMSFSVQGMLRLCKAWAFKDKTRKGGPLISDTQFSTKQTWMNSTMRSLKALLNLRKSPKKKRNLCVSTTKI